MDERVPETFAFQAADGTTYEIPVCTAAEAERLFRIAQGVVDRFASADNGGARGEPDGYAPGPEPEPGAAAPADDDDADCGGDGGDRAAPCDIDKAIDIMVAEGVPRENTVREPWITFTPRSLGWRDATGRSPARLCVRGVGTYVLQGPGGTLILDEGAACAVPGGILMHPAVAFHCPIRACMRLHTLDLDGPWHSTRDGARAVVARSRAYIAAGLPAIAISTVEHPLGTWAGSLQKTMRRHLRGQRMQPRPRPRR